MGQIVILGWDGLDYDLLDNWDLRHEFGTHADKLETFDNPVLEAPHTKEVWPSIITGEHPRSHGIWASKPSEEKKVKWESKSLRMASYIGSYLFPKSARTKIGEYLINMGADTAEVYNKHDVSYYLENNIKTLFDGKQSRAISIPNYKTNRDVELEMEVDRVSFWEDAIDTVHMEDRSMLKPLVSNADLDEELFTELYSRVGILKASMQRSYDIIFCWFGFIDTVGHLSPLVDENGFQRRHYETAANITNEIRAEMDDKDTLISISDHGIRDGIHTHDAVIASDDPSVVDQTDSVFDFRETVNSLSTDHNCGEIELKNKCRFNQQLEDQPANKVEQHLKELGYIS